MDPNDERRAREVGKALRTARGTMSVAEASRRSGLSRQWWMDAEKGVRRDRGGQVVTVLRPQNLAAALRAVGGDVAKVFALAGMDPGVFDPAEPDLVLANEDGTTTVAEVKGPPTQVYIDTNVLMQLVADLGSRFDRIEERLQQMDSAIAHLEQPPPPQSEAASTPTAARSSRAVRSTRVRPAGPDSRP